ncbi:MAG: aminotransferase class I/II-fold pyridoxal phosphate-dependent enzyme, partial [Peptostreptococcaceae bacterium]
KLKDIGYDISRKSPIIPIIIGEEDKALEFSKKLFEEGIHIPAIRYPTVKKGEARLRMTLMATIDYSDIDFVVDKISKIKDSI